jgi:S-adenosylmethionine/arginine decarboxylase-like enzyme
MFTVWAYSHASGHSWPEYQGLALDLFSCKEFDEDAVVSFIQEWFSAERMDVLTVERFFGKAQEIRSYTLFN